MSAPDTPQSCLYCDHDALWSLVYMEGKKFIPVCSGHDSTAREDIQESGYSVTDKVMVSRVFEGYGRRVDDRRMASMMEAPPAEPPPLVTPRKAKLNFLQRLGKDWTMLRARRVTPDRMDVLVDGDRFTVHTRGEANER